MRERRKTDQTHIKQSFESRSKPCLRKIEQLSQKPVRFMSGALRKAPWL